MKVLFIGGTGTISSACTQLAVDRGIELHLLNRGRTDRPVPAGARVIHADVRDVAATRAALGGERYDAVVDWIAFTPAHVAGSLAAVRDRTAQYAFIGSASAYETPPAALPVRETTPLGNPYWEYSRNKIVCETMLADAARDGVPVTVVRPSQTYDARALPFRGGYTVVDRMRRGAPVVVHGDGTSVWVLTHHRDFAVGLVGLLGNPAAIGETFHITSDELLTWNGIYREIARAAGVADPRLAHVTSERIARHDADWGAALLGDQAHSMIFDNTKIRRAVPEYAARIPFRDGAAEMIAWYDADPARRVVDREFDALTERILAEM
jgi:nucleoside-diphosphate-sugar epimerase